MVRSASCFFFKNWRSSHTVTTWQWKSRFHLLLLSPVICTDPKGKQALTRAGTFWASLKWHPTKSGILFRYSVHPSILTIFVLWFCIFLTSLVNHRKLKHLQIYKEMYVHIEKQWQTSPALSKPLDEAVYLVIHTGTSPGLHRTSSWPKATKLCL